MDSTHGCAPERNECMLNNNQYSTSVPKFNSISYFSINKQTIPSCHVSARNAISSSLDVAWKTNVVENQIIWGPQKMWGRKGFQNVGDFQFRLALPLDIFWIRPWHMCQKIMKISYFLGGSPSLIFFYCAGRVPPFSPLSTPMYRYLRLKSYNELFLNWFAYTYQHYLTFHVLGA